MFSRKKISWSEYSWSSIQHFIINSFCDKKKKKRKKDTADKIIEGFE